MMVCFMYLDFTDVLTTFRVINSPLQMFICISQMICVSFMLFTVPAEDVENFDVAALPLDTQRNIEADSFWCMSKLLDGIQVCSHTNVSMNIKQ